MHVVVRQILSGAFAAMVSVGATAQELAQTDQHTTYGPTETRSTMKLGEGTVKETLRVSGGTAQLVTGPDAGYAFKAVPGIKRITTRAFGQMQDIPRTGLYIVDADYVPATLMQQLKQEGYRLLENGELIDRKGEPITLFVRPETFRLIPETIGPPSEFFQSPAPPSNSDKEPSYEKQGLFLPQSRPPTASVWSEIKDLANRIDLNPIAEAKAASPFPWTCFSWTRAAKYRGGFCRDYRAWTNAFAWGPGPGGSCNNPKPHTRIEFIRAFARAALDTDDEHCFNCEEEHAFADFDIGCWWPAHGKGNGFHFIHMVDRGLSVSRSFSWTHQ